MAILFFEGFNIQNTDLTPYLDPSYWSRPFNLNYPQLAFTSDNPTTDVISYGTNGHLRISGYRLDSTPPEVATPLQLSGVSGLNSNKLYLSFRVQGLTHNDKYNNSFPFAAKLLTFCDGDAETLTFDVVRTSGLSIQGGSSQWVYANIGLGISVKQSGNEIGLFDLRLGDIPSYSIVDYGGVYSTYGPLGITRGSSDSFNRYIHLEFLINKNNNVINLKLDGFDVLNRLTDPASYSPNASGQAIGNINNIKFYNKGGTINGSIGGGGSWVGPYYGLNNGAITLDDLAICNDSGNSPNIWMGPKTRIYLLSQQTYGFQYTAHNVFNKNEWSNNYPVYTQGLNSRDGDSTYISSDISGSITSLQFLAGVTNNNFIQDYFQNGIGGVRIFNDVRKTFLDSNFINVYGTGNLADSSNYKEIGALYEVKSTAYDIKNSFIFNNPNTNIPWTSGNFFSSEPVLTSIYGSQNYVTSGSFGVKKL